MSARLPASRAPNRRRNALNALRHSLPRRIMIPAIVLAALLLGLGAAHRAGLIIGNASPSVPRGLYLKASPDHASHITFCLGDRHRDIRTGPALCSPETPDAPHILKRIAARHADGSLTVAGDTPRALDSRYLGPIRHQDIRGWWVPLITERGTMVQQGRVTKRPMGKPL